MERSSNNWYKKENGDRVWWLLTDTTGDFIFSFDKIKQFNLFADYPQALAAEEKAIFDKENPYWVSFFADRQ